MGCGSSSDGQKQGMQPQPSQSMPYQQMPGAGNYGWGAPMHQVVVQPPNDADPAFMQTVAPSGTTWGQYVRTGSSFIDPRTGHLGGPWAECISWAVIFEKTNEWSSMPQYKDDGVVGGVLAALESSLGANPKKDQVMEAAVKLENDSQALCENGTAMPQINQMVTLPQNAVPGSLVQVQNMQTPGTMMTVNVPPNAQPGQQIMAAAPVQPNASGGMSTGGKVALAAGGAVAAGALAAGVYYGVGGGGGMDGFVGDAGAVADSAGDAAGSAADWAGDAAGDVGDWAGTAVADVGEFGGEAIDDVGGFIEDLF